MDKYFDINESGCSIRSKLYCGKPDDVRRVVVFCHGFGGHKDNKAAETFAHRIIAQWKGTAVVTFDWPCHGEDARKHLSLVDCDTYLGIVVSYVQRRFQTDELYAYGTSFGGFLLLKYLLDHGNPFRRIALRCPAVDMLGTFMRVIATPDDLRKLEAGKTILAGFDRKVKIDKSYLEELRALDIQDREFFDYAESILILQGTADEVVSYETTAKFADDNAIEFVPVEGADHRFHDPKKMDMAIARIISFFEAA